MTGRTLIEFAGLPGTGKSTLARKIAERLACQGVPVVALNEVETSQARIAIAVTRVLSATRFAIARPRLAQTAVSMVWQSRQMAVDDARAVLTNWLCKGQRLTGLPTSMLAISDEGLLHAIWSTAYSARRPDVVSEPAMRIMRRLMPDRWIVLIVRTSDDSWQRRLLSRPGLPNRLAHDLRVDGPKAVSRALRAMETVENTLDGVVLLEGPERVKLVPIDNSRDDPSELADGVARMIGELAEA